MKKIIVLAYMFFAPFLVDAQTYQELVQKAFHYVEKDSLDQAVSFFTEALKKEPANVYNA